MLDKLNCVFLGTPEIANDTLEALVADKRINVSLVVSMPDRPAGRGKKLKSPDVIIKAKELGLDILQTENINKSKEFLEFSSKNDIHLMIVFAFAQFLKEDILHLPKLGCFNIHTSLLPKYRGAAPMQHALFNGDKETGLCIQKMVKKMDAGNIVKEKKITIEDDDNLGTIHDKLKDLSPVVMRSFLEDIFSETVSERVQDESKVSFAPSISKEETLIDFEKQTSVEIQNKIRGLSPIPGAYCFLNNKRLKVYESELSNEQLKPFEVSLKFNTLVVGAKTGSLRFKLVQQEGKPKRTDYELINGFKSNNTKIEIHSTRIQP
ncbi:MAG: methionyl-tRNA formyltransferase [Halobacteriovorax sp.]|nr:methionyl-tRNA formyltransferase [Halobacteriovorax sp.]